MKVSQLLDGLNIKSFDLEIDFEENVKDINIDSRNLKKRAPFFLHLKVQQLTHMTSSQRCTKAALSLL